MAVASALWRLEIANSLTVAVRRGRIAATAYFGGIEINMCTCGRVSDPQQPL
jgi:hypothetical protein